MMGLLIKGAYSADAALDDNAPLHGISMSVLTGPLVENTSAGRDTLHQRDFPRHTDASAGSEVEILYRHHLIRLIAQSNRH
jgi:hypothetical protein